MCVHAHAHAHARICARKCARARARLQAVGKAVVSWIRSQLVTLCTHALLNHAIICF